MLADAARGEMGSKGGGGPVRLSDVDTSSHHFSLSSLDSSDVYRQLPGRRRSLSLFLTHFLLLSLSKSLLSLSFYFHKYREMLHYAYPIIQ